MTSNSNSKSIDEENKDFALQAELCQSLTHPFRLKLIRVLKDGPKKVGDIELETERPQPFISQHLRVLREKGVVTCQRKANEVYYSLADPKILDICKLVADIIARKSNYTKRS
ncbi:MAG: ArsR/SmtB family transcription factor [Candidatus Hodarchaeota archaeon]